MAKRATGGSPSSQPQQNTNTGIFPGRVEAVILDDQTYRDEFKSYGEWSSIGCIFFSRIEAPNPDAKNITSNQFAKPLFPNQKQPPLNNEIVYILPLPSANIQSSLTDVVYYYFQPVNIWNNNHHNAIPNPLGNPLPDSQQRDYQQTEAGAVRKVTDGGTEIELGNTFEENLNTKTTQPFEGDIIYEGRWGQSIRLGSTVNNASISNTWSKSGENGDPITIIKNAPHSDDKDPWVPQVEDINQDKSSIYLTSTQLIPLKASSTSYKSYTSSPDSPNSFSGEQIILNSNRLIFNSKTDHILLSSAKSINLNSIDSINIDSPKTVLQSNSVLLGDKNASEAVILGDKFLTDFSKLLSNLIALSTALQTPIGTPAPFVPNVAIPAPAVQVTQIATTMLNKIIAYKSKVSKTK